MEVDSTIDNAEVRTGKTHIAVHPVSVCHDETHPLLVRIPYFFLLPRVKFRPKQLQTLIRVVCCCCCCCCHASLVSISLLVPRTNKIMICKIQNYRRLACHCSHVRSVY